MRRLLVLATAATWVVASPPLTAQERPADDLLTVGKYLDYETVGEPAVSPDGSQVIFTRRSVDKMKDNFDSALWIMKADGSKLRFLVKGSAATWSPDGTRIAYLAEAGGGGTEPGRAQLFVRYMDAEGAVTQVTNVQHAPGAPKWSPDGKWLGFPMFVPKETTWRIDLPPAHSGPRRRGSWTTCSTAPTAPGTSRWGTPTSSWCPPSAGRRGR